MTITATPTCGIHPAPNKTQTIIPRPAALVIDFAVGPPAYSPRVPKPCGNFPVLLLSEGNTGSVSTYHSCTLT